MIGVQEEEKGRENRRSRKAGWERQGHIRKDGLYDTTVKVVRRAA